MEEKKNTGLIWLLIILIILVSALIVLVVYKGFFAQKLENNNLNTTVITESTTTNTTTTKKVVDNSKYDEVTSFDLTLNNVKHEIAYKFNIIEVGNNNDFGDYLYRYVKASIFIDEKFIKEIPIFYDINDDMNKVNNMIKTLNKDNVKILKGTDNKDYLVFLIQEEHEFLDGKTNPIIVNELGKILYEFDYQLGGGKWIEDTRSKLYFGENYYKEREYLIEDDKIYFIETSDSCPEAEDTEYGYIFYFQESVLTIDNNKINIVNGNCYKGNAAGAE